MTSGVWTPQPPLDIETTIRQEFDGTAVVYVMLDGRVIAHLDVLPLPTDEDRREWGYAVEVDAYAYETGTFDEETRPTRIKVHPFAQDPKPAEAVRS